jgi:hypothetical protein
MKDNNFFVGSSPVVFAVFAAPLSARRSSFTLVYRDVLPIDLSLFVVSIDGIDGVIQPRANLRLTKKNSTTFVKKH